MVFLPKLMYIIASVYWFFSCSIRKKFIVKCTKFASFINQKCSTQINSKAHTSLHSIYMNWPVVKIDTQLNCETHLHFHNFVEHNGSSSRKCLRRVTPHTELQFIPICFLFILWDLWWLLDFSFSFFLCFQSMVGIVRIRQQQLFFNVYHLYFLNFKTYYRAAYSYNIKNFTFLLLGDGIIFDTTI